MRVTQEIPLSDVVAFSLTIQKSENFSTPNVWMEGSLHSSVSSEGPFAFGMPRTVNSMLNDRCVYFPSTSIRKTKLDFRFVCF